MGSYYSIGNYLEIHHMREVQMMEKKLCNCHKDREFSYSGFPYTSCTWSSQTITLYWDSIVKSMKVEFPEIAMELFLLDIPC